MGTITGNTRRTANIGSSGGGGSAVKTIYTDNDTIDDQIREVSLYGNTSSDKLIFQNLGGFDILTLYGNRTIDFGSGTQTINANFYMDGDVFNKFSLYNKTNASSFCDIYTSPNPYNGVFELKNGAGNTKIKMEAGSGATYTELAYISLYGQYSRYKVINSIANTIVNLGSSNSETGNLELYNAYNVLKINLSVGGSIIDTNLKVGGSYASATAALEIVGPGSTLATTTALFQNSSSVNALKIRDDNYLIQRAINAAILDADLSNNEMSAYINEATSFLIFKVKTSTGVVKTASIGLV